MGFLNIKQRIGIIYKNENWAKNIFTKLVESIPFDEIKCVGTVKKDLLSDDLYCELNNGSWIRTIEAEEGKIPVCDLTRAFVEPIVDDDFYFLNNYCLADNWVVLNDWNIYDENYDEKERKMEAFSIEQRIGIFCNHFEWGVKIFDRMIDRIPEDKIQSIFKNDNQCYCKLKNGDGIKVIKSNVNPRGYRLTKMIIEPGIDDMLLLRFVRTSLADNIVAVFDEDLNEYDKMQSN